jgi:hypothetical protein
MSELQNRENEIREAAKGCKSLFDLRMKFPRWTMEAVRLAAERYAPHLIPDHALTTIREAKTCPKPAGKQAKGAKAE